MRAKLKRLAESDYRVNSLREDDFDYTMRLLQQFVQAQATVYKLEDERVRAEEPELADDILDDVAYYNWIDTQYIWHFGLWRLQGILEGLITGTFLHVKHPRPLIGLKAKLDAMRSAGYTIDQADYDELLEWAKLRNALSHAPPEQYGPGPLEENDVYEYKALVERLCQHWRTEETSSQIP